MRGVVGVALEGQAELGRGEDQGAALAGQGGGDLPLPFDGSGRRSRWRPWRSLTWSSGRPRWGRWAATVPRSHWAMRNGLGCGAGDRPAQRPHSEGALTVSTDQSTVPGRSLRASWATSSRTSAGRSWARRWCGGVRVGLLHPDVTPGDPTHAVPSTRWRLFVRALPGTGVAVSREHRSGTGHGVRSPVYVAGIY